MERIHQKQTETPFRDKLTKSEISPYEDMGKLNELGNNPDKIVRIETFEDLEERYNGKFKVFELVKIINRLYKELEEDYGIPTPVDFLVSKDEKGGKVVFAITDKIEGKNLKKIECSQEIVEAVERLYSSIAQYYLDKLLDGGYYLTDINGSSQYVYGNKKEYDEKKIYLVDTDIYLDNRKSSLPLVVTWLSRHMSAAEHHLRTRFSKARETLGKFVSEYEVGGFFNVDDKEARDNILEIKKFLAYEKLGNGDGPAIPSF